MTGVPVEKICRWIISQRLGAADRNGFRPADYLLRGDLSHRNRQIFEALGF